MLIDFGGTLDADGEPWVERFFRRYQEVGGTVDRPEFSVAFSRSDAELARLPGIGGFDYSALVAAQADLLAGLLHDGAVLRKAAVAGGFVASARNVALRNREILIALSADFRLAVVSNYQGNLQPCLDELGLGDLFDVVSDSEIVGARKPDRRIFDTTLAALGCTPAGSWMIGDSPANDIAAAAALGMRTCWVASANRPAVGIAPTVRVSRFDQVPRALVA
ncbi:MAG: HAD family hydrolase [Gemmatimonadales bacterium]